MFQIERCSKRDRTPFELGFKIEILQIIGLLNRALWLSVFENNKLENI